MVEGIGYTKMAEILITFFTEPLALDVAARTLRAIGCKEQAEMLLLQEVKLRWYEYIARNLNLCKTTK